jgi:aminopeptidase N
MATVVERIADIDDGLARTLCWGAAWDMTRDAEMAARDYVRLALRGVLGEAEIGVVQAVQARIGGALERYADPAWARDGWIMLADLAADAVRSVEPGSDFQLAWVRTFAAASRTPAHIELLRGLLDGSETVPGLVVDTELRWTLLQARVALGDAGDADIDLELERDNTASGQRRAATARALRPTAEAKAEAWRMATTDVELPNAIIEAIAGGFYHPAQHALTEPYVQRYFETIGEVWGQRSGEMARLLTVRLYPDAVSDAALAAADAFMARNSLPAQLRRLVSEGRDDVERALRARKRFSGAHT